MSKCGNAFFLNREIKPLRTEIEIKGNIRASGRAHHVDGTKGQSKGDEHGRGHTPDAVHHGRARDGRTDHIAQTD